MIGRNKLGNGSSRSESCRPSKALDGICANQKQPPSMMAAAAMAAGVGRKIFVGRDTAQLQSFGDVLADGFLDLMNLLLRVQKPLAIGLLMSRSRCFSNAA